MVGTLSSIPTRSQEQAQEWSLVLLSQGIESAIGLSDDTGKWEIEVDPGHFSPAVRILRQYTVENKKVVVREKPAAPLVFDWGNSWFFTLLVVLFVLMETRAPGIRDFGAMQTSAFLQGQWWRPFTAILLHHNPPHLAANVVIGMLFLGLAGGLFGTARAFLISFSSGVIANVVGCLVYTNELRLGASGMVMGALGLLTADSVLHRHSQPHGSLAQRIFRGISAGVLLLILLGFDPDPHTDVLAHMVGFVAGLGLGLVTLVLPSRTRVVEKTAAS